MDGRHPVLKGGRDGELACELGTLEAGASATVTALVTPARGG